MTDGRKKWGCRSWLAQLVCVSLLFSSVFSPVLVHADDSSETLEIHRLNSLPDPSLQQPLEELEKKSAAAVPEGQAWADQNYALLGNLLTYNAEIFEYADELEKHYGKKFVDDQIKTNALVKNLPGFGKVLITTLNDPHDEKVSYRISRIIHEKSGNAYLMLDSDIIATDSPHLKLLVARQHIEANEGRGRNVVLVWLKKPEGESYEYAKAEELKKNSLLSAQYWRDWWKSKYKAPTQADREMAVFTGLIMQGALATAASAFKMYLKNEHSFDWSPTLLSSFYGLGIGTYSSTYRNIINSGSNKVVRTFKQAFASSAVFAYTLTILTKGFGAVSFMTSSGLLGNAFLWINMLMNNFAKDEWWRKTALRTQLRENITPLNFKILDHKFSWNRASFEQQMIYLMPWTLNLISLLGLSYTVPHTAITIPFLQFIGMPIAQYMTLKHIQKLHEEKLKDPLLAAKAQEIGAVRGQLEERWRNSWGMDVKEIPGRLKEKAKSAAQSVNTLCSSVLSKLNF